MKSSLALALGGLVAACGAPVEQSSSEDAGTITILEAQPDAGRPKDVEDAGQPTFTPTGKLGASGVLFFDVRLPTGQTNLRRGRNSLLVIISRPTGPLTDAVLTPKAYMPTMNNMPSPTTPQAIVQGLGVWEIVPIDCNMGGLWEVSIKVTASNRTIDTYKQAWQVN